MSVPSTAFYCVTGRDFFPGAVALLNSLRLVGHSEPLFVLDAGMESHQRERLACHATVIDGPEAAAPSLLKLEAPLAHPADAMVLLDADVIVTRPLTEQIAIAAEGALACFRNDRDRFFAEWRELLDLPRMRRGPYLTSSALFLGREPARELLPLVQRALGRVDPRRTWIGGGGEDDPLYYFDQDVINAVVRSRLEPDRVVAFDTKLAPIPPFRGLRLAAGSGVRCRYRDGTEPYMLHHAARKPWLVAMRSSVYSRLLTRLLLGAGVELRLDPHELPTRLRTGLAAGATRGAVDVFVGVPAYARRRLRPRRGVDAWVDRH